MQDEPPLLLVCACRMEELVVCTRMSKLFASRIEKIGETIGLKI